MRLFKFYQLLCFTVAYSTIFSACQHSEKSKDTSSQEAPGTTEGLFTLLPAEKTNIHFNNKITENPYGNILTYQYFYNGGGVAVGDINNDGLQDVYFSGNMSPNRLYLNKGTMQFEDISAAAGVEGRVNTWKTGVSMADVNGDGLLDIYVCYSGHLPEEARINQLFINKGVDNNGQPQFEDQAQQYGLADAAYSIGSTFFDYDKDGDLDMFLLNHNPALFRNLDDITIKEIQKEKEPEMRVKLYKNDKGSFKDVSDKAGFAGSALTYALGAGVADINNDGWLDIYVSNDYSAPDYLYINNGNGTFTDQLQQSMGHISYYSMGNDIADINNDGLADIFTLDMLPEDNKRQKLLFAPDNYEHFDLFVRVGFYYQYMRNMLHINNGNGTFSEVGQLSGISNTDWSWAPLFADFDNDGWKDLFVSNGFLRDFTNMDFIKYRSSYFRAANAQDNQQGLLDLVNKIPSSNVSNYIFKNNGDLSFSNKAQEWGMNLPSNSNGAAYADLDNDGDLDMVVNNINQTAFIYQNQSSQKADHHYLQLQLKGAGQNTQGIGAKVLLYHKGQQQYQEQVLSRGYQSSISAVMHFGVGKEEKIDSLRIVWPNGKQQLLTDVKTNQLLILEEEKAGAVYKVSKPGLTILEEVPSPIAFASLPKSINDFKRQPLLVNPMSFAGPCMVKGDVNGDGLEDIYVGGDRDQAGALYLQQKGGKFIQQAIAAFEADKMSEDTDALWVDVNKDGLPDLYVCSGGYDSYLPEDPLLQDRLYINDGKGGFTKSSTFLPLMLTSTSCVRAADVNGDGHMDLFVGGRVIPGRYPETPRSYVLINDGKGAFKDMTASVAPQLAKAGLVTDAAWVDLNADQQPELVVVGEWMPVTIYKNTQGKLREDTDRYLSKKYSGWWNKLIVGDFNGDQKPDLLIGNQGLNSQVKASEEEPAEMYYKDFDDNGAVDPVLCFYIQGKSYPYITRDELMDQMSIMRTRFSSYESYANASLQDIFTENELKNVGHLSANGLKTIYLESSTSNKLVEKELPVEVQYAPVFAGTTIDYNQDGKLDLLLGGNITQARLRFGKYDASYGVLLQNDGKGGFTYIPQHQSGLQVKGDVRSIVEVNQTLLFGINQKGLKAYKIRK